MRSKRRPAPGVRWVYDRCRRVRGTSRVLDARRYEYEVWRMIVRRNPRKQ